MPQGTGNPSNTDNGKKQVIDFNEVRAQRLEEKRRKTERIFFKSLLSVYSLVGDTKMLAIDIIDVSEDGLSFQIPYDPNHKWPKDMGEEIPLRLYFSQDTYLEVRAKIQNSRPSIEGNQRYTRFGCAIDKSLTNYPAYQGFVRFLKAYSEHARKDQGDVTVFYL
jgi:hypothetical protein